MFQLRPYQKQAVDRSLRYLREASGKYDVPSISVLPTGSGKSLVIANIAKELPAPTLVLQPSKEILEQNVRKIKSYGCTDVAVCSASAGEKDVAHITYGTIGTVEKMADRFKHVGQIIVDECHLVNPAQGMYKKFFAETGINRVLGLTATPYRLKSFSNPHTGERYSQINLLPRSRPRFFSRMIHITQIEEIQDFLAPIKYISERGFDHSQLTINSTGADFDDRSLRRYLQNVFDIKKELMRAVQFAIKKGRKHILVFCAYLDEAEALSASLRQLGIGAGFISGQNTKKERESLLENFQNGNIEVMCNVGVLTTGFDFPELDCIIIGRPTMSLALYYQMVGRGMRPHVSKDDCLYIDLCGNIDRFGRVEDLRLVWEDKRMVLRGSKGVLNNRPLTDLM